LDFHALLKRTLINKVKTFQGDEWTIKGTRMSGDVDTSLGNSIINYALLSAILHDCGYHQFEIIVNGDDSILFTKKPINVQQFQSVARKYNMESKVLPSTTIIHQVEFCRTKLVYKPNGQATMMFNPKRSINIFGMHYKCLEIDHTYLYQTAYANSIMHNNTELGNYWFTLSEQMLAANKVKEKHRYKYDLLPLKQILKVLKSTDTEKWTELTPSMFIAWGEEITYFLDNISNLRQRNALTTTMIIDHMDRTVELR
jgi:hypothetical protein